jgi:hypothetical protein
MTQYEQLLTAVTSNVDDDAARLAFAAHIRSSEPDRARFIEDQIERAKVRRAQRGHIYVADHPLLRAHDAEWSRILAKYARRWIFDRGFIEKVEIDPHLLLEYGDWLLINYPIVAIDFRKPEEGPFPTKEIAESPLLARFDALRFHDVQLSGADVERLVRSPHLRRLRYLDLGKAPMSPLLYDALAANPETRKILRLVVADDAFPGQRYADTGRDDMQGRAVQAWTDLSLEGKALEAKYGYIPWLHEANIVEPLDAAWFVAQGILPAKPVGSPVT